MRVAYPLQGQTPGKLALIFLGILLAMELLTAGLTVLQYHAVTRVPLRDQRFLKNLDDAAIGAICLNAILYIITIIFYLVWLHGAYTNIRNFGAIGLHASPGWAVSYHFIPILNLFRPYQVMQEIWKASDPQLDQENRLDWQHNPGNPWVVLWWLFWILASIAGRLSFIMGRDNNPNRPFNLEAFRNDWYVACFVAVASNLLTIIAGLLLFGIILAILKRQRERHRFLGPDPM